MPVDTPVLAQRVLSDRRFDLIAETSFTRGILHVERRDASVEITERGGQARAALVDIASLQSVEELFATIDKNEGRLDLLINNVGNYNPQPIEALEPAHWDATLQTNLSGAF